MEVTELTLLIARAGVLALMYLLLLVLVLTLRADVRAAMAPARSRPAPPSAPAGPAATTPGRPPSILAFTGGTVPSTGREYQLFGPLQVGRSLSNNIAIPNNFVSTHHARLFSRDGRWFIEDLGSTNGTLLNGKRVTDAQPLKSGDTLTIGDTQFTLR